MKNIEINGVLYTRQVELLGDVEQVRWYLAKSSELPAHEIYEEEVLHDLENQYEALCLADIIPSLPII